MSTDNHEVTFKIANVSKREIEMMLKADRLSNVISEIFSHLRKKHKYFELTKEAHEELDEMRTVLVDSMDSWGITFGDLGE